MQLVDGTPVYSATDLVGFIECRHLSNLERAGVEGLVRAPMSTRSKGHFNALRVNGTNPQSPSCPALRHKQLRSHGRWRP